MPAHLFVRAFTLYRYAINPIYRANFLERVRNSTNPYRVGFASR